MKKHILLVCTLCCGLTLIGCSKPAAKYYETAQKYLTAGNYEQAIEAYQQVLKIDSKNIEAYTGLAEAYQKNNQPDLYMSTLETGYKETSDDTIKTSLTTIYSNLKQTYISSKDETGLINMYLSAISTLSKEEIYYKELAEIYKKNGNLDKYKEILQQGVDNTKSPSLRKLLDATSKKAILSREYYEVSSVNGEEQSQMYVYDIYQYNSDGKVSTISHYEVDDVLHDGPLVRTYTYDSEGKVILINNTMPSTTNFSSWIEEYKYDAEGKLIQCIFTATNPAVSDNMSKTVEYDAEEKIISETSVKGEVSSYSYTYDDNGRILTQTVTEEKNSRSTTSTYEYDETGNLLKERQTFSYDPLMIDIVYKY